MTEPHVDAVSLEIFRSALTAIAEEMGAVLTRTSYSPNIKERRDFSCAIFDAQGRLVTQAAHIPVHLGAMPDSVAAALAVFDELAPGDVVALNDPFLGGSHLPDITLITPMYATAEGNQHLVGYAASRAHHADVGGMSPGSMPMATELYQEGIIIPPTRIVAGGEPVQPVLNLIMRNVRTPDERRGDLNAQIAANRTAARRMQELIDRWSLPIVTAHIDELIAYTERITRATIAEIPDGTYEFRDQLDNDGVDDAPVEIHVTVTIAGSNITMDFSQSAPQTRGNINTVAAITRSAVYYVVRCLMPEDAPTNHGTFIPVTVIVPEGSVLNARPPAAVAQGNVETSQRITDTVLGALAQALPDVIPAASQGTMNNITAGGTDPRSGRPFAYYETMGGGTGALPQRDGLSGVHSHMSNTLNTPVEAFEFAYPMRIAAYRLRDNSGGDGQYQGGNGLVREIIFQVPTDVTLLTERRRFPPYGLQQGATGQPGENILYREGSDQPQQLGGKVRLRVHPGDRLRIASPGGGGWGDPAKRELNPEEEP
jgi:N-methylhydantoinase B